MKFAILGSRGLDSTYSGYETLVRHLAPYLVGAGHDVTVYGRRRNRGRAAWMQEGARCIATPGLDTKSLSTLSFGLSSTLDALFRGFDAVLVLNIANGFWLPLLRVAGVPTAVNTDGLEWQRGKWNRVAKAAFLAAARLTATHATEVIADSTAMGDIWRAKFGRASTFIPYGAPVLPKVDDHELQRLGLADRPFLLSVARLVPENNVDLTLDALDLMDGERPVAVIVGSGVGEPAVEARLRELQARGRVLWLGHVDDQELLDQLWGNCSVYVHGHSVGGTNPSLLQALGAGAPTLALDTPFNAEVLRDRRHLYDLSPEALAGRIAEVLRSEELRAELAGSGRREVEERYAWEDVCRGYLTVLERLGRSRRDGSSRR
ncbi:MAG TPA: glycosyltransferase [Solirubrobacterales bacterium]|nr:glycosyltransferase [Solirubrobacterales bacterium]